MNLNKLYVWLIKSIMVVCIFCSTVTILSGFLDCVWYLFLDKFLIINWDSNKILSAYGLLITSMFIIFIGNVVKNICFED